MCHRIARIEGDALLGIIQGLVYVARAVLAQVQESPFEIDERQTRIGAREALAGSTARGPPAVSMSVPHLI